MLPHIPLVYRYLPNKVSWRDAIKQSHSGTLVKKPNVDDSSPATPFATAAIPGSTGPLFLHAITSYHHNIFGSDAPYLNDNEPSERPPQRAWMPTNNEQMLIPLHSPLAASFTNSYRNPVT